MKEQFKDSAYSLGTRSQNLVAWRSIRPLGTRSSETRRVIVRFILLRPLTGIGICLLCIASKELLKNRISSLPTVWYYCHTHRICFRSLEKESYWHDVFCFYDTIKYLPSLILQRHSQPRKIHCHLIALHFLCAIDETENVVVDKVAALSVGEELEGLSVVHGLLFLVDLYHRNSQNQIRQSTRARAHTKRAPVTRTRIPPFSLLGWASRVATWCRTFWKGSP